MGEGRNFLAELFLSLVALPPSLNDDWFLILFFLTRIRQNIKSIFKENYLVFGRTTET